MMINEETAGKPAELDDEVMDSMDSSELSDDHSGEHSEDGVSVEEDEGALTKATLLTFTDMNSPWLSMGVGIVTVEISIESTGPATPPPNPGAGNGKMGKAEENNELTSGLVCQRVGRLVMVDLEDPDEVLLSTPIDIDGMYQMQGDAIIMWEDAQLGRTMAFKFNRDDGAEKILREVTDFQKSEQARNESAAAVGASGPVGPTAGGKAGAVAGQKVGDKFSVSVANLPTIVDAVNSNPLVFGIYVREDMTYFRQLATLFDECRGKGDTASMERIAQITLALLGSPYNSEGKILGQFMESAYVDRCVDIVQYALGRKDKASGFVSFAERRATFRNPLNLPEPILQRIHLLYSAMYLKDLLPLSLDDGDGGSPCVLNLLLLRFKFTLVSEICTTPEFLQRAFELAQTQDPDRDHLYALAAFVQDMSKMVKNAPIPLDMKEDMYNSMIQGGLFRFCQSVLLWGLKDIVAENETVAGAAATAQLCSTAGRSEAARAVEASCDVLSHCLFIVPTARDSLKSEAEENPTQCSLRLVMQCFTVLQHSSALQAAYDVVLGAATGAQALQVFQAFVNLGAQRAIIRFWVEGSGVESPPLFLVASHVASLLEREKDARSATATWTQGEERQLVCGFRVLNAVAEKVEEGFRTSFAELLKLSRILPAARTVMRRTKARRLENVQSSIVSFLTKLVTMGDGNVMKLFEAAADDNSQAEAERSVGGSDAEHLLSVCMTLYLASSRRGTILSGALGALFVNLCTEVHQEKLHLAEAASPSPLTVQPSFVTPMDGSNPLCPDMAASSRDAAAQCRYQKAASTLMSVFGERLDEHIPVVADRLRTSLRETPEEAKRAEAETSSMPSTMGRPGEGLSEYDAVAMDFGVVDVALPSPHSRSSSSSPLSEAAVAAAEDSLLSSLMDSDSDSDADVSSIHSGTSIGSVSDKDSEATAPDDEEDVTAEKASADAALPLTATEGTDKTNNNSTHSTHSGPAGDGDEEEEVVHNTPGDDPSSAPTPTLEGDDGAQTQTAGIAATGHKRERTEDAVDETEEQEAVVVGDDTIETANATGNTKESPAKKLKTQRRKRS